MERLAYPDHAVFRLRARPAADRGRRGALAWRAYGDSIYRLASITKTFTGTLVAEAVSLDSGVTVAGIAQDILNTQVQLEKVAALAMWH